MPECLEKVAILAQFEGIIKKQLFHDLRNEQRIMSDRLGLPHNTLNAQSDLYTIQPTISSCEELGEVTDPTIWHAAELHRNILIYCNP